MPDRTRHKRAVQSSAAAVMLDLAICGFSLLAANLIRFEGLIPERYLTQLLFLLPTLAIARVSANYYFGIYRVVWRYVGLRETMRFIQSIVTVSAALMFCRVVLIDQSQLLAFPIGIIVIEGILTFVAMTGARFLPRIVAEHYANRGNYTTTRTLLVGAGRGGLEIAREALRQPSLGIRPVGYIDDDASKAGMEIHGLRVLGTVADISRALEQSAAERVIITTESIPATTILELIDSCREAGVGLKIVPRVFESLGRKTPTEALRDIRIEDLLSRAPVGPSLALDDLKQIFGGKRLLVTGAGGSIGSELCRQLALLDPDKLLLIERDETNLFEIEREITAGRIDTPCVAVLCDITNDDQLERVFTEHKPEVIFHAAAFKHVPLMERFPEEAIRNNVFGTQKLARLASAHRVERFLMISTDKAVKPSSVMGASKRVAENIIQQVARESTTKFSCVRFGNVLGSRGSVVGIFRDQIQRGGPVTVTHPEARRYFMTIPEAVNLVIQAATVGGDADIFLLDMGEPVKIIDLARQMIHLSGTSERDIPIEIVGTRPGEKLFEELRTDREDIKKTELRRIFRCVPEPFDAHRVERTLERLKFAVRARDRDDIRECLRDFQIDYAPMAELSAPPA